MTLFCDECGLANAASATHCVACQQPLVQTAATSSAMFQVVPVNSVPPVVQEVSAGNPPASNQQSEPITFLPGTILAEHYRIEQEIGRGGFSIVYRAVDLNQKKLMVAIKRIQLSTLTPRQSIDATETFNREVAMLSRFEGMHGVPIFYEHLTDAENWYLVMEYIQGSTLEEHLQKMPGGYFDEKEAIHVGLKLAQILQELHTDNPPVIFRDVKPANIMFTPWQELFLIDFGIARNFTFGKARDTTPLGSPGYASPEQYGRAQTDRRADIYGLGATLQTLFTGRDPLELAAGEPSRNPKPPSPALRTLLDEMLSPDTTQRPIDMRYVQTRLENILQPKESQYAFNSDANKEVLRRTIICLVYLSLISSILRWSLLLEVALFGTVGIAFIMNLKWFKGKKFFGQPIGRLTLIFFWVLIIVLWLLYGLGGALPF